MRKCADVLMLKPLNWRFKFAQPVPALVGIFIFANFHINML